jgi:hypothetical protein
MSKTTISALVKQKDSIPYRKELRKSCGSVSATILFQQMLYWFSTTNYEPFYKFSEPCSHDAYKEGDSWSEELGFSIEEFNTAFQKIGKKYKSKKEYTENKSESSNLFFIAYTDRKTNLTWYEVNLELVEKCLELVYSKPTTSVPRNQQCRFLESDNLGSPYNTETTTETTTEIKENKENSEIQAIGDLGSAVASTSAEVSSASPTLTAVPNQSRRHTAKIMLDEALTVANNTGVLPISQDISEWYDTMLSYVEHRDELGRKLTTRGLVLLLKKVSTWNANDIVKQLEASIVAGYPDVYEPREVFKKGQKNERQEGYYKEVIENGKSVIYTSDETPVPGSEEWLRWTGIV